MRCEHLARPADVSITSSAKIRVIAVYVCVLYPAEGERKRLQPGVHVPPAFRSGEGVQRQHVGHAPLPGISCLDVE